MKKLNHIVQKVGIEVLIHDPSTNVTHLLNPTAAKVYMAMGQGQGQPEEIFSELDPEIGAALTQETLRLLTSKGVLKGPLANLPRPSRRDLLKCLGASILLPSVVSIGSPSPANAASASSTLSFPQGTIPLPLATTDLAPPPSDDITSSCVTRSLSVAAGQAVRITFDGGNIIDDVLSISAPLGGVAFTSFLAQIGTVCCPGPFPVGGPAPSVNAGQPASGTVVISSIFNIPGINAITVCHCDTAKPALGNPSSSLPGFTITAS